MFARPIRQISIYRNSRLSYRTNTFKLAASAMSSHNLDLMREIVVDHDNIRDLRERFEAAHKEKDSQLMGRIATTMIQEASLHSDGEELSVYKALDAHDLHNVAEHDREDHQHVKQAFSKVDKLLMGPMSPDLDELVTCVREASDIFIKHAEDEEKNQYPQLIKKLGEKDATDLTKEFLNARKMAPSRPHPSAPQSGGAMQAAAGMMSKPMDAMVQAWRDHVPLKHHHAEV
ncbi:unnamed protein product [Tilletia controversa]|uniref:Hemerythrin-like domain-containing protein n=3 Tax=Tilletia TaxID=13289 RepID=A0A8X7MWR9_9BASI|nr:hypothetical protein CF336_g2011 [Tilletia laevis]KAE8205467.1 hypothetical protein CF328_g486 [Tilletia controversa]KAE8263645.1 hypothetical protein A4X03_0g1530 [Tilletia caries]KAE8207200.1 hypothetical protein CF335_g1323 [Tilletia laevis]KAE8252384.1 hypothetical protein A4X06_0g2220 [Tilletia controversa]